MSAKYRIWHFYPNQFRIFGQHGTPPRHQLYPQIKSIHSCIAGLTTIISSRPHRWIHSIYILYVCPAIPILLTGQVSTWLGRTSNIYYLLFSVQEYSNQFKLSLVSDFRLHISSPEPPFLHRISQQKEKMMTLKSIFYDLTYDYYVKMFLVCAHLLLPQLLAPVK